MKVETPVLEQIMSAGIQGNAANGGAAKSEKGEAGIFAAQLRGILEAMFPVIAEGENEEEGMLLTDGLAEELLAGLDFSAGGLPVEGEESADFSEKVLTFLKEEIFAEDAAFSFSSGEVKEAESVIREVLSDFKNGFSGVAEKDSTDIPDKISVSLEEKSATAEDLSEKIAFKGDIPEEQMVKVAEQGAKELPSAETLALKGDEAVAAAKGEAPVDLPKEENLTADKTQFGDKEIPADRFVKGATEKEAAYSGEAKKVNKEDASNLKVADFISPGKDAFDFAEKGIKTREEAGRFVQFEPEKEFMLNLSRFQVSDIFGERMNAPVVEELTTSQQVRTTILDQITGRLNYFRETGNLPAEMRMTLNPPTLGEVIIRVFSRQGVMTAEIITEVSKVKELLETAVTDLKQRLQAVNIVLERIDVFTAEDSNSGGLLNRESSKFAEFAAMGKFAARVATEGEPVSGNIAAEILNSGRSLDMWA